MFFINDDEIQNIDKQHLVCKTIYFIEEVLYSKEICLNKVYHNINNKGRLPVC